MYILSIFFDEFSKLIEIAKLIKEIEIYKIYSDEKPSNYL